MKMTYTKVAAKNVINEYKNNTAFFDGSTDVGDMYNMLRYRMGFGEAETQVIIAALVLSGAKFS